MDDDGDFGDFSSAQTGEDMLAKITGIDGPNMADPSATFEMNSELCPLPDFHFDDNLVFTEDDTVQATVASFSSPFWASESTPMPQQNEQPTTELDWGTFSGGEASSAMEVTSQTGHESMKSRGEQDEDWGDFGGFETAGYSELTVEEKPPVIESPELGLERNDVFMVCFGYSPRKEVSSPDFTTNFRWLTVLQKSIDFTLPLCKWDASYLQNCYYSTIKVDPLLVSKVDITFVTEVVQFPTIEGQSAALDLMESFGFEGAVEPASPTDTTAGFLTTEREPFPVVKEAGPTLLDLTLPTSPSENTQQDSFVLDADLEGLQLQSSEREREKTSIEQLALNEKLVVNRTTWVDSELEQLGDVNQLQSIPVQSNSHEQNKGVTKKATFQEQLQQLGLDTSKTSLSTATTKNAKEMSISARLVLDRLPNVLFMLEDNIIPVQRHYYHS